MTVGFCPRILLPATLLAVTLALSTSACGQTAPDFMHNNHQGPGGDGAVGAPCAADPDCRLDLVCVTEMPHGMCSAGCDETHPCPDGANCVRVTVKDRANNVCLPPCRYDAHCREDDGYFCFLIEDTGVRVCWF